jgi:predicted enzyme related to lactoylglutathione lyase
MLGKYPSSAILPATDLARAKKFYMEKLGLEPMKDMDMDGMLLFQTGGDTKLVLYTTKPAHPEHTQVGFDVDDLDVVIDELVKKGVKMEQYDMPELKTDAKGIVSWGPVRSAWFKDSEGNIIALNEMKM